MLQYQQKVYVQNFHLLPSTSGPGGFFFCHHGIKKCMDQGILSSFISSLVVVLSKPQAMVEGAALELGSLISVTKIESQRGRNWVVEFKL